MNLLAKFVLLAVMPFCLCALSAEQSKTKSPTADDAKAKAVAEENETQSPEPFNSGAIMQVVPTKNFVEFSELDPLPSQVINWDKNSGRFLYISKEEPPFIFLFGTVRPGYEVSINNKWLPVKKGRFEVKINLPLEPSQFTLKMFDPERKVKLYRLAYSWLKFPPALRFRVKEEEQIVEKAWGYSGRYSRSGWVQLYAGNNPVPVVDLDSIRQANLSFRIYYPPEPEDIYDGWSLVIFNSKNELVAEYKKLGAPPPFIDWRDVAPKIFEADSYTYRLDLFRGDMAFQGKANRFDTIESYALVNHRYRRNLEFEPQEIIGYFSYSKPAQGGAGFDGVFVGADLAASFWNQFLMRGTLHTSVHNLDQNNVHSFFRAGIGIRVFGGGHNDLMGDPYLYRLDVYLNISNFTVNPNTPINLFTHPSILIEPHFLLWNYHYIVPFIEYGTRLKREEERLSFGVGYHFYIRPWSTKLGIGFSDDRLLRFDAGPNLVWNIFKTWASLTFIL